MNAPQSITKKRSIRSLFVKKSMDMTDGNIWKLIIYFAFPLLIGNLFQQLYNTVDSYVVGNFVSNEAFAAVGSTGPIINTLIGFFSGLSTGASVVISQYFGAKDEAGVRKAVHTTIIMTAVLSVVFTIVGVAMVPGMLKATRTPDEVFVESQKYLTIYFSGISATMFYNIGAGILRAVGDSRRPFLFLALSAVINIVLDLVFVIAFNMGVEGVAYATLAANLVSAILVLFVLARTKDCYRLTLRHLKCNFSILKRIIRIGFPAALQLAITAFSNVFVQSYINKFGRDFMSGWSAYAKIDQFLFLPMQSISLAATTFVGQNLGAGKPERAKRGTSISLILALSFTAVLMIPVLVFAPYLVTFFNKEPAVVQYGTVLLRFISPFYLTNCINQICAGALRGAGKSVVPMISILSCFVAFRQVYLMIASLLGGNYLVIAFSYPAGWMICSIVLFIYYRFSGWEKRARSV